MQGAEISLKKRNRNQTNKNEKRYWSTPERHISLKNIMDNELVQFFSMWKLTDLERN